VITPAVDPVINTFNEEKKIMSDTTMETPKPTAPVMNNKVNPDAVSDETSVITAGTVLTGDIASDGSFDIQGTINGNVTCNGKLVVTGTINGNSAASEFFADVAKVEGEVVSSGTVKIGAGSVIIGNIAAASAVIAGAIKGDIDVQGPVVVDTSAVVMGNIKSRSVQINNGAVIEGFCSQCYADIDVQGLFDGK
jgi:cytoskeletal protein CcmA (bactofilin family)